ncbi:hypothetical protein ACFC1R_35740, partial [Kitasatospora sp. NPDC056138]
TWPVRRWRADAQAWSTVSPTPPEQAVIEIQAPGRIENSQVGVFLAYASSRGWALIEEYDVAWGTWIALIDSCIVSNTVSGVGPSST